jgi:hypothetical protein
MIDMNPDIKRVLDDHELRLRKLESAETPIATHKQLSIREFILSKKPQSDTEKTLIIGFYLEKYEKVKPFNVSDLEAGFRRAKEPAPDNINYNAYQNVKKGYFDEAKEKKDGLKAWYLTNSGETHVNEIVK